MNKLTIPCTHGHVTGDRLRDSALDLLQRGFVTVVTAGAIVGAVFLLLSDVR